MRIKNDFDCETPSLRRTKDVYTVQRLLMESRKERGTWCDEHLLLLPLLQNGYTMRERCRNALHT